MLTSTHRQEILARCATAAFDVPMADYSSFKAGGQAAALVDVRNLDQLRTLLEYCAGASLPWRVIGRGSNILVLDRGFEGVLFRLQGAFRAVHQGREFGAAMVTTGGGCPLAELLGWCRRHGFGGLEFLAGIPGGVGGALRMNAGAFGHSIGEFLHSVLIVGADGIVQEKVVDELTLGYRRCTISGCDMDRIIFLSASLQLQEDRQERIAEKMRNYIAQRKDKQPLVFPSAGSFFKNPEGDYAGRLIEAVGLKGARVGGAMVSPLHANFIVNAGGKATATDIVDLMHKIQEKVRKQTGIFLEPEVHIL